MRHGHRHPFGHFHLGLQLGEFGGLDLADYLVICPAGELARLVSAVFMSQLYVVGMSAGFTVPSASGAQVLSTTTASMLSPLWFPLSSVYRSGR